MSRESCIKVLQDVFERDMACVGITLTHEALEAVIEYLKDVPSADVQQVVRCKDCKYCDTGIDEDGNHFLKCLGWAYGGTKEDDYCSHGVRKD